MKKYQNYHNMKMQGNVYSSKAEILEFLKKRIKKSKIEKLLYFDVLEWEKNQSKILELISKNFHARLVIVRSSAKGEDSAQSSQAGIYESVLNVNTNSKNQLKSAIISVINSYVKTGNKNSENKILIQEQTKNIAISGVVFTRTPDIGAPYFVINFDKGESTETVTSGLANTTIKIFRKTNKYSLPKQWNSLLEAIQEIESIVKNEFLDIEFGITKSGKVVIFQVRPLTSVKKDSLKGTDAKIEKIINQCKKKFLQFKVPKSGNFLIFSDMADWNPAEIIGNNPNLFDYSLYNYLIMSGIWCQGRKKIGYQKPNRSNLMEKFGNKPYVNVRESFSSLIPYKINKKNRRKLMEYYFKKLRKFPFYHDKVEFEILFTCYDIMLNSRMKELSSYGFNEKEINEIIEELKNFTNQVLHDFRKISGESSLSIKKMRENRINIFSQLNKQNKTYLNKLNAAEKLLENCRDFGTLPFSTVARLAFIGTIILKSLLNKKIIDSNLYNNFMNSIDTPVSKLRDDFAKFCNNKLSKQEFMEKYGHLRAGTYDITASRYDQEESLFDKIQFLNPKKPHVKLPTLKILKTLSKNGLNFDTVDFFSFVRKSLILREELKFVFSRNLSDAIELITQAGTDLGFSRNDLANLDISTIFDSYKKHPKMDLKNFWRTKINYQKKKHLINSYLVLPPILFSAKDFEIIEYFLSKPNFITTKSITAEVVNLKTFDLKLGDVENKIVLIENADPGFDWIFTQKPAGLITKYGGVASHMSIRCAELGLPAAIGCGEILYENLIKSSKILLDCKNEQIIILEHENVDEILEARKILKSLGYIK